MLVIHTLNWRKFVIDNHQLLREQGLSPEAVFQTAQNILGPTGKMYYIRQQIANLLGAHLEDLFYQQLKDPDHQRIIEFALDGLPLPNKLKAQLQLSS